MQLLLDAGNTRIKWGALDDGNIQATGEMHGEQAFRDLSGDLADPEAIWVASVRDDAFNSALGRTLDEHWPQAIQNWPQTTAEAFGVHCAYPEPATMGVDRWLAVLAARQITQNPACVVDAGSAVTLDALDPMGRHLGGLILPGMAMARSMMQERTARVRAGDGFRPGWWTDNTSDAVNSGCHWAIVSLVERFRTRTEERLAAECELILTGGDAPAIMDSLAGSAQHEPHLVLRGLALMAEDGQQESLS